MAEWMGVGMGVGERGCGEVLVERPFGAVFGVFDGESEGGEAVADFVARGPVFVGFGFGAELEEQVDGSGVGLGVLAGGFGESEAHDVFAEGLEEVAELVEVGLGECGFAVGYGVDDLGGVE